jgi:hypothetical protein
MNAFLSVMELQAHKDLVGDRHFIDATQKHLHNVTVTAIRRTLTILSSRCHNVVSL